MKIKKIMEIEIDVIEDECGDCKYLTGFYHESSSDWCDICGLFDEELCPEKRGKQCIDFFGMPSEDDANGNN